MWEAVSKASTPSTPLASACCWSTEYRCTRNLWVETTVSPHAVRKDAFLIGLWTFQILHTHRMGRTYRKHSLWLVYEKWKERFGSDVSVMSLQLVSFHQQQTLPLADLWVGLTLVPYLPPQTYFFTMSTPAMTVTSINPTVARIIGTEFDLEFLIN